MWGVWVGLGAAVIDKRHLRGMAVLHWEELLGIGWCIGCIARLGTALWDGQTGVVSGRIAQPRAEGSAVGCMGECGRWGGEEFVLGVEQRLQMRHVVGRLPGVLYTWRVPGSWDGGC